jgi:transcriptional regulator with XRE-family HTH domain
MSPRLPNYLVSHRKRLGLSQEDVAHLLGVESGAKFSRYEQFVRRPNLETALACEIVLQCALSELFSGIYENLEGEIRARAKKLLESSDRKAPNGSRRRETLSLLAGEAPPMSEKSG